MAAKKQLQALADKILTAALAAKFELETFNAQHNLVSGSVLFIAQAMSMTGSRIHFMLLLCFLMPIVHLS
ncbi:MAG: hypothetical protein GY931_03715 [Maribacter sp.]|nr:hypothetical protein [Maribacter sp.]